MYLYVLRSLNLKIRLLIVGLCVCVNLVCVCASAITIKQKQIIAEILNLAFYMIQVFFEIFNEDPTNCLCTGALNRILIYCGLFLAGAFSCIQTALNIMKLRLLIEFFFSLNYNRETGVEG